jgi:uncharacterized protein YegP (UPF0339 family)
MYSFEIYKDRIGEYRWRFKAPNGEIVAASEGYTSKQSCQGSIQLIKMYSPVAPVYDLTPAARMAYR